MAQQFKVVKGTFFGTSYYAGKMKLAAVEKQILEPSDSFWDPIFDPEERAQRELNKRRVLEQMVPYLEKQFPFFSALTTIMVPIDGELLKEEDAKFTPSHPDDPDTGTLTIDDQVYLFPADGQHRRDAIAQALKKNRSIHSQEVPVIFLPFEGVERVRQLFADLNLNAKPVNKTIGLAYDRRDPVVIIAKRLMMEVPLFAGDQKRVNTKSNSLAVKSPAVISMNTLVEGTTQILAALLDKPVAKIGEHPDLQVIETLEPTDKLVEPLARRVADVWEVIIDSFPLWQEVLAGELTPGQVRDGIKNEDGTIAKPGNVFAFGLGWQALGLIAAAIIRYEGDDWSEQLAAALGAVDWQKGPQWDGIAMVGDRVNNTGPGIRATAGYVLSEAGYGDAEDEDIQGLVSVYEKSAGLDHQAEAA